jgi:hypothetical protein
MQIWGNAMEGSAWAGGKKLILNPETLGNFDHMTSNKINFPKGASANTVLGAAGCRILEPKPIRNISKKTIRSC